MNDALTRNLMKSFLSTEALAQFLKVTAQPILFINSGGIILAANDAARRICLPEYDEDSPNASFEEAIDESYASVLELIRDSLRQRVDITRQIISCDKQIYLVESKAVAHDEIYLGCSITFTEVTATLLKDKQHELLFQISSALSSESSLNQVLKVAITQIMQSLDISHANIMLIDETSNKLKIKISTKNSSPSHASREIKIGEGLAGRCAKELRPYSAYDITQSGIFTQKRPEDQGALLVVPMISRGKLLGVINVANDEPRFFTESEVQFLTILANDIAIALENGELYERLNNKAKQLSKLFWISSFAGIRTLDNRIQRMVKLIAEILDTQDCCIYIHSSSRNKLILKYQKDVSSPLPIQIDLDKNSLSRSVLYEQEMQVLNDVSKSDYPNVFQKYPQVQNIICSPILVNQKPIGVIHVINKRNGNFDEEDKHLLTITTHRIGTIIENAQLLRKVAAEKDLLDNIIRYTSEGVAVLNRKKRIIIWNRYLEELTGIKSNETVGLPCYKVLYTRLGLKKLTQQLYTPTGGEKNDKVKESPALEEEIKTINSDLIWLSTVYSHLYDTNHNVEYTIIVFRNISKEKEFLEAKNEFVSLATHELRTPLTAIKGYLSMILKGDSGMINPKQRDYFNKAYLATERLVVLVEELLDVARIDEERLKFNITFFPMHSVIEECVDSYLSKAHSKNLTLTFRPSVPIMVKGDPDKTKQIVCNLIDNAIKYTRDKGMIQVETSKSDHDVHVTVQDNGVGIPAKYLNSIFDRFVRAPNSLSVKAGGTGLGLYIAKNLVEKQGGKIWVTSQTGKETAFHFTLPLAKGAPSITYHEREERI